MRISRSALLFLPLLSLAGCAAGDRGLVSPHQPLVTATGAAVPHCPDWSDKDLPPSEGQSRNYGCATATNLAAMIADPADLIHGKTDNGSTMNAESAVRAVRAWRDAPVVAKTVDKTSAKGGN